MPIAFFLVAMIALLGGWYQSQAHEQDAKMIQESEAMAVASNITAYHLKVMKCARYKDADGNLPHWARFNAFNGSAQEFLVGCVGTPGPQWVNAPFNGVTMTISPEPDGAVVVVNYNPIRGLHATRAGVQANLNKMTHNSIVLGQAIWGY